MNPTLLKTLKARYHFDKWARAKSDEQLFVRNFRVSGDELPNSLIKSRTARLSGARRLNTSLWATIDAARDRQVLVDVFEYYSAERAHEALLEFTGQFHQPTDLAVRTDDVGEVCIETPDGAWFAFVRGNLVVRVVSGEGKVNSARVVAQLIDADLMAKPDTPVVPTEDPSTLLVEQPAVPHAFSRTLSVAFTAEGEDELPDDEPMIKVFSKGGSVVVEQNSIIVPESPAVEVEVFVSEPGGRRWGKRYQNPLNPNVTRDT